MVWIPSWIEADNDSHHVSSIPSSQQRPGTILLPTQIQYSDNGVWRSRRLKFMPALIRQHHHLTNAAYHEPGNQPQIGMRRLREGDETLQVPFGNIVELIDLLNHCSTPAPAIGIIWLSVGVVVRMRAHIILLTDNDTLTNRYVLV